VNEVEQLVAGRLTDPHHLLGAHPHDGGVVVRAWRPEAQAVVAKPENAPPVELELRHPAGLFEGVVPDADAPLSYELEVSYPDGNTFTLRDPYAFPPTLGELDLHLAGEGRHERIYERLGAHLRDAEGVTGTAFAVWAPNAAAVSVVGDFNSWDGRLHPMRSLGSSGIWELFLPDVGEGQRYKYEIQSRVDGAKLQKADPYGFFFETDASGAAVGGFDAPIADTRGTIESSNGSASVAPRPRRKVRRGTARLKLFMSPMPSAFETACSSRSKESRTRSGNCPAPRRG